MHTIRYAAGLAACVLCLVCGTTVARGEGAPKIEGSVLYRTGLHHALKPDRRARVLLFRGDQPLALKSAAKLRDFEKRYPEGLERREDRPIEEATRSAAMVLLTYDRLHARDLVARAKVGADGSFVVPVSTPGRYTLLIESGATAGSYHLKRYDVRAIEIGTSAPDAVKVDFGVSHLEHHDSPGH